MTWQLLLLISILLSSAKGLFHRAVMKDDKSDPLAQTILFGVLAGIFSLLIALSRGFHLPSFPFLLPNFLLMIVLLTLAPLLTFKAYRFVEASEIGILMSTQSLWTVVLSFIFLKETVALSKIAGTLLILTGLGIACWKKQQFEVTKGTLFVLVAASLYGISYVNAFFILQHLDAPSFEVYAALLPSLVLLSIQPKAIQKMRFYLIGNNWLKVFLAALFDTLAVLSLYFAYQLGRNASQISPLSTTSIILTVILAAVFLKEKERLVNKLLGATVAVLGLIMILKGS